MGDFYYAGGLPALLNQIGSLLHSIADRQRRALGENIAGAKNPQR